MHSANPRLPSSLVPPLKLDRYLLRDNATSAPITMLSTGLLYLAILASKGIFVSSVHIPRATEISNQNGPYVEEYVQPEVTISVTNLERPIPVGRFYSPPTTYEVELRQILNHSLTPSFSDL